MCRRSPFHSSYHSTKTANQKNAHSMLLEPRTAFVLFIAIMVSERRQTRSEHTRPQIYETPKSKEENVQLQHSDMVVQLVTSLIMMHWRFQKICGKQFFKANGVCFQMNKYKSKKIIQRRSCIYPWHFFKRHLIQK